MTETRPYDNSAAQAEKLEVLKDTYLSRAQSDADLGAQGRFKRETTTTVHAVPTYPALPASSPWAHGFDTNIEPVLGIAVDEMPVVGTEVVGVNPPLCADNLGGSVAPTDAASLSDVETGPPKSMKRRSW